jgi:hypothetical protein
MANIVELGTVTNWGVTETAFTGVLLVDSLSIDNTVKNHVVTNEFGQNVGWIGYDQSASFSLSARPIKGQTVNYELASIVTLNSFESYNMFNTGIAAGADARTAIVESVSFSQTAEAAQSLDFSGTIYNFATSAE